MKKLTKLSLLIFVPIVLGTVLAVIGGLTDIDVLYRVGIDIATYGSFATAFILVVVSLVLIITGRTSDGKGGEKSDNAVTDGLQPEDENTEDVDMSPDGESAEELTEKSKDTPAEVEVGAESYTETAAEEEERALDGINSSYGYESQYRYGEYQMNHVANNYAKSSKKDKVLGWLFFGFLMASIGLAIVFIFLQIWLGAIICGGLFAGTIIISLIVKKILEGVSKSRKVDPEKWEERRGKVLACVLSSSSSTGGSNRNSTVRVSGVTYRIVVEVDGKEYSAYSTTAYDEGTEIWVYVRRDGKGSLAKLPESTDE